jgi:predicted RNase H-like nuclease (RuvC/YqgF family)
MLASLLNSANFWFTFISSVMLVLGGVWGLVKGYHQFVAHVIQQRRHEEELTTCIHNLQTEQTKLRTELHTISKDITPNGKNTQRLGDIVARSEEKIDNLMDFMTRYAEKVDSLEQQLAKHIGYHEGADL